MLNIHWRLQMTDLKDPSHEAVVVLLSLSPDNEFLSVIEKLMQGQSQSREEEYCDFYEPEKFLGSYSEAPYDGVKCGIICLDEEVEIDRETFLHYLKIACQRYLERVPQDKEKTNALLDKYSVSFLQGPRQSH